MGLDLQGAVLPPFWQCHDFKNRTWGLQGMLSPALPAVLCGLFLDKESMLVGTGGGSGQVPWQPLLLRGSQVVPGTAQILILI